jgi:putative ABC transport system permease protein
LPPGYNASQLENKLSQFIKNHFPAVSSSPVKLFLIPLKDLWFRPEGESESVNQKKVNALYIILAMGVLFLAIVCINYINLTTARYTDRLKEVGVRKSIGASRINLISQFLGESIFYSTISMPLALLLYEAYRPALSATLNDFDLSVINHPTTLLYLAGVTLLVGIVSGSYPALLLARFNSIQILQGKFQGGKKGGGLRKILVVVQFSLSIMFITLALTYRGQREYLSNIDPGYDNEGVIMVSIPPEAAGNVSILQNEIRKFAPVNAVSTSTGFQDGGGPSVEVIPEGSIDHTPLSMTIIGTDYDFLNLFRFKVTSGRNFSAAYSDENSFIITEKAAKQLGWENPIGKMLTIGSQRGQIIGVVNNFITGGGASINPSVFHLEKKNLSSLEVKVSDTKQIPSVISEMGPLWKTVNPDVPFQAFTLKEHLEERRSEDARASIFVDVMGIVAVFFSSLGLFGLVSYSVRQRTKELGVRKVLGASSNQITIMLGKNFMKLVLLSNIIGIPIGYFLSNGFLTIFDSRMPLGPGIFILSSIITLITAIGALYIQIAKGANANPVESLRYE